jgi:hypothetical protein
MENAARAINRMMSLRSTAILLCFGISMEPCLCAAQVSMMAGPQSTSGTEGGAVYGGSSSFGIGGAMPGMGGLSPAGGYGTVSSSTVLSTVPNGLSARVAGIAKRINAGANVTARSADLSRGMLPSAAMDGSTGSFAGHGRSRRAKGSISLSRGIADYGTKTYKASDRSKVNMPYQSKPTAPRYETESWLGSPGH